MASNRQATVLGVFHDRARAEEAVRALRQAGFTDNQIGLVSRGEEGDADATATKAAAGAATGAAAGAGVAALVSLGMSFGVIPVIGPILAVGPLAAALISAAGGAAAAGLAGALIGMGIPEHEAKYYEGEVHGGRTLLTVQADERSADAWAVMQQYGAYNHQSAAKATSPSGPKGRMGQPGGAARRV